MRDGDDALALADDIKALSERVHADLEAAHDYYFNTKRVWRLVKQLVADGQHFTIVNRATEEEADEKAITSLSRRYVAVELASATLERYVAILEDYLVSLHRGWLVQYPGTIQKKQLSLSEILPLPDKAAIIDRFIDKELRDFAHKRPEEWFEEFGKFAKLGCPTADQIERICEIKATRDILVHNRGVVNWIYLDKSKNQARYAEGDIIETPDEYLRESWDLIKIIVRDMSAAATLKLS